MTITLEAVTSLTIFHFLLVLCRIGSMIMLMPGVGEMFVPARVRLLFALGVSFILTPVLSEHLPPLPDNEMKMTVLLFGEIIIGIFIGAMARLLQSVVHVAGMIMAFMSSLGAAMLFDSTQGSQGSVFGNLLTIMAITLFFACDLHIFMLRGISDSYQIFIPGDTLPIEDFSTLSATLLSEAFVIGFRIAAPIMVIGLTLYLAAGVMGRLMPAMQVFFILTPLQVVVSFQVLIITISVGMMLYISHFEDSLNAIFYP